MEYSWEVWQLMEATGWDHLPFAGGLLDQPEDLMADLIAISARRTEVEELLVPGPRQRAIEGTA